MVTAKAFGMKVTQYFVGFGPTLWSFRRGETEYGVKAIPLGGFVQDRRDDPARTTTSSPADEPRAMWRFPVWKRTIVHGRRLGRPTSCSAIVHLLSSRRSPPACPTRRCDYDADGQPVIGTVATCVVAGRRRRHGDLRACTAGDPAGPAKRGRAAARRRDHRGRRHAGRRPTATLVDAIRAAGRPAGRRSTYERDGADAARRPSTWSRRSGRRSTTRTARRHARAGLGDRRCPDAPAGHGRRTARSTAVAGAGRLRRRRSSSGTFEALDEVPGEDPEAVRRAHRRRARPGRPRSAWSAPAGSAARPFEQGECRSSSCCCSAR